MLGGEGRAGFSVGFVFSEVAFDAGRFIVVWRKEKRRKDSRLMIVGVNYAFN